MRIFCIGRNYLAHVQELQNEAPSEPVVFIKPPSCLVAELESIPFPAHGNDLQHEAEIVIEIAHDCKNVLEIEVPHFISRIGIGLDLTLRDVQSRLKSKGLPWEKAKAFDGSSPLGKMIDYTGQDLANLQIACKVNREERQNGTSQHMLFSISALIMHLSSIWQLRKGDLIYTGTPEGVGSLKRGDRVEVFSEQIGSSTWTVEA
jgi:acylpyruvate hydrolase